MAVSTYSELLHHVGHKVVVVAYGNRHRPENVAVECEDCGTVLLDFDRSVPTTPRRPA